MHPCAVKRPVRLPFSSGAFAQYRLCEATFVIVAETPLYLCFIQQTPTQTARSESWRQVWRMRSARILKWRTYRTANVEVWSKSQRFNLGVRLLHPGILCSWAMYIAMLSTNILWISMTDGEDINWYNYLVTNPLSLLWTRHSKSKLLRHT